METQENSFNAPVSNKIVSLLGNELIELLLNSTTLTLYEIDETSEANSRIITYTHFYGYKINELIFKPALSTLVDLKSFFLSLSSYNWNRPVANCVFEPGFALSFGTSKDENLLSVFICFKCDELLFQWGNGEKINKTYFAGNDILLILLKEEFKASKKIIAIQNQILMLDDYNENDVF